MGLVFQEKGKHRLAIEEFKAAVAADSRHVQAYNGMGVSYDELGRHKDAANAYLAALEYDMTLDYVFNNLGYCYLLQGRHEMAAASFEKALRLNSENHRYRNNLGLALAKLGRYDEAFEVFLASSDKASAHRNVARLCFKDGKYAEAERHFAEASNLEPSDNKSDRAMMAAANLAEIHQPAEKPAPLEPSTILAAAPAPKLPEKTSGGIQTFPAGAIQDAKISEIRLIDVEAEVVQVQAESETLVLAAQTDPLPSPTIPAPVVESVEIPDLLLRENPPAAGNGSLMALAPSKENQEPIALAQEIPEKEPRIHIELSNGNGVRHMAKQVGTYLRPKGFVPMYLTNAKHFNHNKTQIFYTDGYREDALRLAETLPGTQKIEQVSQVQNGNAKISLLIGKDLVPISKTLKRG
jgi:Tfp pilus assembly protein PilF